MRTAGSHTALVHATPLFAPGQSSRGRDRASAAAQRAIGVLAIVGHIAHVVDQRAAVEVNAQGDPVPVHEPLLPLRRRPLPERPRLSAWSPSLPPRRVAMQLNRKRAFDEAAAPRILLGRLFERSVPARLAPMASVERPRPRATSAARGMSRWAMKVTPERAPHLGADEHGHPEDAGHNRRKCRRSAKKRRRKRRPRRKERQRFHRFVHDP